MASFMAKDYSTVIGSITTMFRFHGEKSFLKPVE
jgi:hypothetical protein